MKYPLALAICAAVAVSSAHAADEKGEWATLKGQIFFMGKPPAARPIAVGAAAPACIAAQPVVDEDWVINAKNGGVKWVVVSLAPVAGAKTLPIHPNLKDPSKNPVVIDQPCCTFIPHMAAMREGQDLVIKNSAAFAHNVNGMGDLRKNPPFNVLLAAGQSHTAKLKTQKLPFNITCNIHGWMNARIAIFDHPYFAITDADGNFEIKDAPVGNFNLKVWHAPVGWRGGAAGRDGEKITIKKGGTDLGKLELKEKYD